MNFNLLQIDKFALKHKITKFCLVQVGQIILKV